MLVCVNLRLNGPAFADCYRDVTRMLQGCYKDVTRILQGYYKGVCT
jgi:hypothetical protein